MSIGTIVQVAGSLLILIPFLLVQAHRLRPETTLYQWLNLIGSGILAIDALRGHQWGFLLLEGSWAIASAIGLILRKPAAGH